MRKHYIYFSPLNLSIFTDDDESDGEMEEVTGYHFMDCVPIFISYIYVTSGMILPLFE
jgi:hypothetical protein